MPDNVLSFDILTSVSRTGTYHAENQPVHLSLATDARAAHVNTNVSEYAGLLGRVCPAAVYEYVALEEGEKGEDAVGHKLVINSQNCIHCKTCSIKVPTQDIEWKVPEGSGGPKCTSSPRFDRAHADGRRLDHLIPIERELGCRMKSYVREIVKFFPSLALQMFE